MKKDLFINIALSILSGILLILSTAGFGLSYLVFIAFVPILYAVRRGGLHPVFSGAIMGFLYWIVCLSWMTITFSYFGGAPLIAAIGMLFVVSVVGGFLLFAPYTFIAKKYLNPFLLAMVFVALEAFKGKAIFKGVPWVNLAQSQYQNINILQFVSWFGELGLSFIIMVINVLIFRLIIFKNKKREGIYLVIAVFVMFIPAFINNITKGKQEITKNIKIIQPGYKQEVKWNRESAIAIINDLNKRLLSLEKEKYDLIVMPESAYPARILHVPFILDVINQIIPTTPIVLGSDRTIKNSQGEVEKYYNSMMLFSKDNQVQFYDKMHLTPFGEYFPFEDLLRPIKEFFFGSGDMFDAGENPTVLTTGDIKIAPLICYETGFSELLKPAINMGANLIVIISNDSWFGKNQGRIQHLAVNVMRVVEYGRSAAVATQDGISAFILPNGEIPIKITSQTPAAPEYNLPLIEKRTLYSKMGYTWVLFVIAGIYIYIKRKKAKSKNESNN